MSNLHGATDPIEILLVEDNAADARLTREALRRAPSPVVLHEVRDGETALAYLLREGKWCDAHKPDIILLDLNLPRKDGRELLAEIKRHEDLMAIPTVVMTTSRSDEDILRAYGLHANAYISKPVDLKQFLQNMSAFAAFWLDVATLPGARRAD